ncbi:hypothetical protein HDV00_011047, partial [Rhizophlyctis rosea]
MAGYDLGHEPWRPTVAKKVFGKVATSYFGITPAPLNVKQYFGRKKITVLHDVYFERGTCVQITGNPQKLVKTLAEENKYNVTVLATSTKAADLDQLKRAENLQNQKRPDLKKFVHGTRFDALVLLKDVPTANGEEQKVEFLSTAQINRVKRRGKEPRRGNENLTAIGVKGRKTGVTVKPNIKKDSLGNDDIEEFFTLPKKVTPARESRQKKTTCRVTVKSNIKKDSLGNDDVEDFFTTPKKVTPARESRQEKTDAHAHADADDVQDLIGE